MLIHLHIVYGCICIHQQSGIVAVEAIWSARPKIFTIWPSTEKTVLAMGIPGLI